MVTEPIIVEETYQATVAALWQAITEPALMREWFFEPMQDFKAEVGYVTRFDVEHDGQVYPHHWEVLEAVFETRLVLDWRYEGYPGASTVTFELSDTAAGAKLRLTHAGSHTFPQDNPIFNRPSGAEGWTYLLQQSLKNFLR